LINDPFSDPDLRKRTYELEGEGSLHYFGSVAMSEDKIYIGGLSHSQATVTVIDKWS